MLRSGIAEYKVKDIDFPCIYGFGFTVEIITCKTNLALASEK
jgi:hypothetical protein